MAFHFNGYRFIGITLGLIRDLYELCAKVSSPPLLSTLGLPATVGHDVLVARVFSTLIGFIALHEFTHHVHGHVPPEGADYLDEFGPDAHKGLEGQMHEIDADGYAVYSMLAHLITGQDRARVVPALGIGSESHDSQDKTIVEVFVSAVGAHYLSRSARRVDRDTVYAASHPLPAARMHFALRHVELWCGRNELHTNSLLTVERFQELMHVVATTIWGEHGGVHWDQQVEFLNTPDGRRYVDELGTALDQFKASLEKMRLEQVKG